MSKIIGYKIAAEVLKEESLLPVDAPELWLVMDKDFPTGDDLPHFYLDEVSILAKKSVVELKEIYKTKKVFPGSRVRS